MLGVLYIIDYNECDHCRVEYHFSFDFINTFVACKLPILLNNYLLPLSQEFIKNCKWDQ